MKDKEGKVIEGAFVSEKVVDCKSMVSFDLDLSKKQLELEDVTKQN